MADIVKDGDQVTRAELARFVAQKFSTFAEVRTTPHQQVASRSSPGLVILGHGFNPMLKT